MTPRTHLPRPLPRPHIAGCVAAALLAWLVLASGVGGLDAEQDWPTTLSLGEQQQVALARLLLASPAFACLDESTSAMPAARAHRLYERLRGTTITYLSMGSDPRLREFHDLLVELGPDGTWSQPPTLRAVSA